MVPEYRTLVDAESLETLPKSGKRKEAIMKYIVELANLQEEGKQKTIQDPLTREVFHV